MASEELAGALFWTVPCLFWGALTLCYSHCIPNRTTPGTREHAVGSENGDRGQSSSDEVILKLVCSGQNSSQQVQGLNVKLTFSGQPKTGTVFNLLTPTTSLSSSVSSSSSHLWWFVIHPLSYWYQQNGLKKRRGRRQNAGREDKWRQIVWRKRKYGQKEQKGMRQKERQRKRKHSRGRVQGGA